MYVWAVIAAIVLFSGGVCDIQELVAGLRRPSCSLSLMDIIEALYCMATVLYAMRENDVHVSNRYVCAGRGAGYLSGSKGCDILLIRVSTSCSVDFLRAMHICHLPALPSMWTSGNLTGKLVLLWTLCGIPLTHPYLAQRVFKVILPCYLKSLSWRVNLGVSACKARAGLSFIHSQQSCLWEEKLCQRIVEPLRFLWCCQPLN